MAKVFCSWIVEATKEEVNNLIEEDEFFLQCYEDGDDTESDTLFASDGKVKVEELKKGVSYKVTLTGNRAGKVFSPACLEEFLTHDTKGRNAHGEAAEWGVVKTKKAR